MNTKTSKESFLEELAMALSDHSAAEMGNANFVDITANCINHFISETMDEDLTKDEIDDMPNWMQTMAKEFQEHDLIRIDPMPSYISFGIMEDFTEMQPDHIAKTLYKALSKRRPFANFKYAVEDIGLLQEWYDYKNTKEQELAEKWLSENGLEYSDDSIKRKANL